VTSGECKMRQDTRKLTERIQAVIIMAVYRERPITYTTAYFAVSGRMYDAGIRPDGTKFR